MTCASHNEFTFTRTVFDAFCLNSSLPIVSPRLAACKEVIVVIFAIKKTSCDILYCVSPEVQSNIRLALLIVLAGKVFCKGLVLIFCCATYCLHELDRLIGSYYKCWSFIRVYDFTIMITAHLQFTR